MLFSPRNNTLQVSEQPFDSPPLVSLLSAEGIQSIAHSFVYCVLMSVSSHPICSLCSFGSMQIHSPSKRIVWWREQPLKIYSVQRMKTKNETHMGFDCVFRERTSGLIGIRKCLLLFGKLRTYFRC